MNRNLKQKDYPVFFTLRYCESARSDDEATKNPAWMNRGGVKKNLFN
jgi:hypothetical protein